MNQLKLAVIRELAKGRDARATQAARLVDLLEVTKSRVVRLATLLANLWGRNQGAVCSGQFGDKPHKTTFAGLMADFFQDLMARRFIAPSHAVIDELTGCSAKGAFAAGGFIYFATCACCGCNRSPTTITPSIRVVAAKRLCSKRVKCDD